MKRPFHFLKNTNSVAIFALLIAHSSASQQTDKCNEDEGRYCRANGAQSHENGVHLMQEPVDGDEQQYASEGCFRSAVVEYNRVDIFSDCRQSTEGNLDNFDKIANIARENGVKMLVFPEDGINYASPKSIVPCLEVIPDPETLEDVSNIPCDSDSSIYDETPILKRLSCIAKQNNLYLVANYGTREACDDKELSGHVNATSDTGMARCPVKSRDFLMLNTNVVLSPRGQFIKRYRKWHPFTESEIFDKAPRLEHVYFDTPYGRFGLFTCFDMIYRDPAVDLVEDYHIDTAIFPTWWFDEAPILTAVQYQDGWSSTNRVNLLAPNILKPSRGSTGSSIFSGDNSLYVTSSSGDSAKKPIRTKLLIASIPKRSRGMVAGDESCGEDKFNPKVIELDYNATQDGYRYRNFQLLETDPLKTLDKLQDNVKVCSGEFCCTLDYQLAASTSLEHMKRLVLIVRDGRRSGLFRWYEQVCAVAVLKEPLSGTGEPAYKKVVYDNENGADFLRLSVRAQFQSKYVYPSTARDARKLIDRKQRRFACHEIGDKEEHSFDCRLELIPASSEDDDGTPASSKIYAFAMYGRVYERDPSKISQS